METSHLSSLLLWWGKSYEPHNVYSVVFPISLLSETISEHCSLNKLWNSYVKVIGNYYFVSHPKLSRRKLNLFCCSLAVSVQSAKKWEAHRKVRACCVRERRQWVKENLVKQIVSNFLSSCGSFFTKKKEQRMKFMRLMSSVESFISYEITRHSIKSISLTISHTTSHLPRSPFFCALQQMQHAINFITDPCFSSGWEENETFNIQFKVKRSHCGLSKLIW